MLPFQLVNHYLCLYHTPIIMCYRLFEIAPELEKLFSFAEMTTEDKKQKQLQHGMQVMESIGAAIEMLDDPETLKETLLGLGIMHNMKDVQVNSFAVSSSIEMLIRYMRAFAISSKSVMYVCMHACIIMV